MSVIKKRELLERSDYKTIPVSRENISLQDITSVLVDICQECTTIELQKNKTAVTRAINLSFDLEDKVKLFRNRLRDIKAEMILTKKE